MRMKTEDNGDTRVVELSGEVLGLDGVALGRDLEEVMDSEIRKVIIDLTWVTHIDSTALGAFIYLNRTLRKHSREVVLRAPSGYAKALLRDCDLQQILTVQETVDPQNPGPAVDSRSTERGHEVEVRGPGSND